jgi:hypothetical protein
MGEPSNASRRLIHMIGPGLRGATAFLLMIRMAPAVGAERERGPMSLVVELAPGRADLDSVVVEFVLKNISRQTLWLDRVLVVSSDYDDGDFVISLIGPKGKEIRSQCVTDRGDRPRYRSLSPGGEIVVREDLRNCFNLAAQGPGMYSLQTKFRPKSQVCYSRNLGDYCIQVELDKPPIKMLIKRTPRRRE